MLQLDMDDEYVLEAITDIETVKAKLTLELPIRFYPPDSWAHGYAEHRAGLTTQTTSERIWISPNTVPRGFVRPDDRRYAELKALMPGYAARFPELPAHSYILKATDGVRSKVIDACIRSQIIIRPLREYVNSV
jgi:hypothetical protein